VLNLGGAWEAGGLIKSIYAFELLVYLCRRTEDRFYLDQDFYWYNPARLPSPAAWVTVQPLRAKHAVNYIWWLAKTPHPKADNSRVVREYTGAMKREEGAQVDGTVSSPTTCSRSGPRSGRSSPSTGSNSPTTRPSARSAHQSSTAKSRSAPKAPAVSDSPNARSQPPPPAASSAAPCSPTSLTNRSRTSSWVRWTPTGSKDSDWPTSERVVHLGADAEEGSQG
jgi:hypothetical protein